MRTPIIVQMKIQNAFHGFGFVMEMLIVIMVVMRLQNYVVCFQIYLFLINSYYYYKQIILKYHHSICRAMEVS